MSSDPFQDAKTKGQDFLAKAKAGTLDEASLKWGLSAGAIVSGVSLFFNYINVTGFRVWEVHLTGLDLLRFQGQAGLGSLEGWAIPLTAILGLYLHFGEPGLKWLKMETPGRARTVYLVGMIMAILGVLGCFHFISVQICLGNALGLVGLGLLGYVFFKLWQMSPAATPGSPPPPPAPPAPPLGS
ncbi:MAG: hypothetical protein ABSE73_08090 [Planctomycetota bacterium]